MIEKMKLSLQSLVIFRGLLRDDVFIRLSELLDSDALPLTDKVSRYADFAAALFAHGGSLTDYVWERVAEDDNIYVQKCAQRLSIDKTLTECLEHELRALQELSLLTSSRLKAHIGYEGYLPDWQNSTIDFSAAYARHLDNLATDGYGIYAKNRMLRVHNGAIVPVKYPDPVRLADLKGYERQKKLIVGNTLALLRGQPAANALLYGDAGTGKSSTVKAIVNEYYASGLRLVEIPKSRFGDIPAVAETLSTNPLKFILFIDDLSFTQQNDDFNALKAVLEGSVSAKATNIVIYATSNRRHMVKELFSDREGDDIHRNETIQELTSLSHRFGLTVGFFKPDKKAYLDIVHALKDEYGIQMDDAQLDLEAERFASAGRSPRMARQFIDMLRRTSGE